MSTTEFDDRVSLCNVGTYVVLNSFLLFLLLVWKPLLEDYLDWILSQTAKRDPRDDMVKNGCTFNSIILDSFQSSICHRLHDLFFYSNKMYI